MHLPATNGYPNRFRMVLNYPEKRSVPVNILLSVPKACDLQMPGHKKEGPRWVWNMLEGTFSGNGSLTEITGYANQPSSGLASWMRNIHSQDRARVMESIARCTDKRQSSCSNLYQLRGRDGRYRLVRDKVFIQYSGGFPVMMQGFVQL